MRGRRKPIDLTAAAAIPLNRAAERQRARRGRRRRTARLHPAIRVVLVAMTLWALVIVLGFYAHLFWPAIWR